MELLFTQKSYQDDTKKSDYTSPLHNKETKTSNKKIFYAQPKMKHIKNIIISSNIFLDIKSLAPFHASGISHPTQ
jgi:hypothetical protein